MRETTVSRRTFLKGSAATAALACAAGSISLGSWQAERAAAAEPAVTVTAPSLCNGCSSKCGLIATTVDGQLWTLKGNEVHPYSKGRICGRGHGLAQMAYSDERVTQPLRRKDDGTFEPIDWDTAFKEIGAKVQDIIAKNGPESLAIIQDPRPSGKQYSARFMNALGSANVYAHSSSCNLSKESAYQLTIGATGYSNDFANAKMVMFIGRSYGDGIRPSSVQSLADAAERPPCSCAVLVLCDLEASSYPVRPAEDAATLLLERLGLAACGDALAASRRRFFRALSCARDAVVCERVLSTADADEAYPAVMYEELIDCYRPDPTRMGDLDRATGLPQALVPFAERAGEDALHANLAPGDDASDAEAWEVPASGDVSPAARGRVVLPREGGSASGDRPATPVLSPSAIESYLECPCKWFSLRRLRLSEPDAGFGPLEMGSFSHGVLKSFYEHFIEAGNAKVAPGNLEEARSLMRETFARHLAFQPELKRKANPLLPLTAFERAEAHGLERRLVSYLDREAALLPGFAPAYFELDFGAKEPFAYGGFELRGSVDRIDVNGRGQAVVIDYKGSLSPDYALASASPAATAGGAVLPHKVQALVYAQVARRLLGLEVVGALYVSYGRDGRVAGAFDRTFVGAADVPGIDAEACGAPGPAAEAVGAGSFAELADRVEEGIARAALSMGAGQVSPDPRGADPCGFCPVLACERRR